MRLILDLGNDELNGYFEEEGLREFIGEVCWSKPSGGGYMHGFCLKFQDDRQGQRLVRVLKHIMANNSSGDEWPMAS